MDSWGRLNYGKMGLTSTVPQGLKVIWPIKQHLLGHGTGLIYEQGY